MFGVKELTEEEKTVEKWELLEDKSDVEKTLHNVNCGQSRHYGGRSF